MRSEHEIFDDLAALCRSQGYIHAIASIFIRDNFVFFKDEMNAEDMANLHSERRLIRTEVTTLIGLMMRAPIDFNLPTPRIISDYIWQTEALLEELHQSMSNFSTFSNFIREAIFYRGDSAYSFQYRDLAPRKYSADSNWLMRTKGIDLKVGREMCRILVELLNRRIVKTLQDLSGKPMEERNILPGFTFSCDELAIRTNQSLNSIKSVVEAFTLPESERNCTFTSLHAFNSAYIYPFIRMRADKLLMLQFYGFPEALYETPFYWMFADKSYTSTALKHRGEFTEAFAAERLARVFGFGRVFKNVEIFKSKSNILGEIDVLVLFGNRAIVLQAKSKKLTLEARKGNERQLQNDFKAAIQDAVNQALNCAELLGDPSVTLCCKDGKKITISDQPQMIFPLTVIVDDYPALALQVRQFLKFKTNRQIAPPLVTDVFALDTITEMLTSPLRFLSYLNLRAQFGEKFLRNHEHTLLSHHLVRNLWLENNVDFEMLNDDISVHLDIAMAARRDGIPGKETPDGILTRLEGTPFSKIIDEIDNEPNTAAIDLGILLLELGEETIRELNEGINEILSRTEADRKLHNLSMGFRDASTGLTIHCSRLVYSQAMTKLQDHCAYRKHDMKADRWFGLALRLDGSIQFIVELTDP